MEPPMLLLLLLSILLLLLPLSSHATRPPKPSSSSSSSSSSSTSSSSSHITIIGTVYCDTCSNNSFSSHSFFLPGVDVTIDCKFKATAPKTAEQITFSVNRTTNRFGWYKLEIPSVDGIQCAAQNQQKQSSSSDNNASSSKSSKSSNSVVSVCKATLVGSSSSSRGGKKCSVPGYKSTSDLVYFKSSETNVCIYGLSALSFRPPKRSKVLCGN